MRHFKVATVIFVTLIMMFSLVGCGGISGGDAKEHIAGFFDKIETDDYEQAETYLHPDRPADLKKFFEELEQNESLDFSSITITRYTGFSSSVYDSSVDGSSYSLNMEVAVGGSEVEMEIEIVKNDNGYGIYNIDIDT